MSLTVIEPPWFNKYVGRRDAGPLVAEVTVGEWTVLLDARSIKELSG